VRLLRRKPGSDAEPTRVPRKDRRGVSAFAVGLLTLIGIVLITYLGFSKHVPFTHGFRVKAVFQSANSIRPNSPVRIAGVNVGKVKTIERQPGADGTGTGDAGCDGCSWATTEVHSQAMIPAKIATRISKYG
jgi:hypothetical protein